MDRIGSRSGSVRGETILSVSAGLNWPGSHAGASLRYGSSRRDEEDDEEALKWAAIEKLPTYDRARTGILQQIAENGLISNEKVLVSELPLAQRTQLLEKVLRIAHEDNERFLLKLRERIDRVGIDLPKIEIRFEHLTIAADTYIGSRALPTLWNFTLNQIEGILGQLHLLPSRKKNLTILNNISGTLKPSRMTLLLGPPGSGKTTLLLTLAGKLNSELKASGKVTYNGHTFSEFVPQRTAAYISQADIHFGEMTVRETLDFSGRCQGVGTRHDMLVELLRREKETGIKPDRDLDIFMKAVAMEGQETSIVTDYVLKILGLDICADTFVGNEMLRGISGGQKKRVTTGEMMVGPARALFMDEISTGLDSSTTYQIVKCLRQSVHLLDGTMMVSLLQPAPETYELFDDVVLLSEGYIVYQGPQDSVLNFFEGMGFKCPERKSTPDFLQEVTSRKDQEQYWADKAKPYRFITAKEFSDAFNSYHVGRHVQQELSVPFDKLRSHPASLTSKKYGLNNWELLKACFWREALLMKRNSFLYVFKTIQVALVAIVTMTVFFRTKLHHDTVKDGNIYLGALYFGLVTLMFNGFFELAMCVQRLPVFYKQRDQMFFPAWAYALPSILIKIPISLLESGIWVTLTYYVIGFAPEASRFFQQLFLLFLLSQMAYGLFRFLGAAGRNLTVANTFGTFALMVVFLLGGFVIAKDSIPSWWIWGYWISPMMYGTNALAVTEFLAPRWDKPFNDTSVAPTVGKAVLAGRDIFKKSSWYWIGVAGLLGFIVVFNIFYTIALTYLNPFAKSHSVKSEDVEEENVHQQAAEPWPQTNSRRRSSSSRPKSSGAGGIEIVRRESSTRSDASEESVKEVAKRGMVLPFQPLSISFDDIKYYVDMPSEMKQEGITDDRLQLLRGVSGAFRPGRLTALVGVSGAGKTTLMDVLAGRKTGGYIEGSINISGYPKNQETFARIAGYCEQTDIHSPNITVKESIIYSAWLRLPKEVDKQTRMMFVDQVMELVELNSISEAIVGLPRVNGLSTEQRKRLTIAVELVANPSIIFMDEPTSGLDARAAAIVMRTVRNTVDTGRTVVCTIHQPSIDIFEAFDELLLMKRGGEVIYAGPLGHRSHKLVEYFESIPGVPKIKEGYNPATWMLEVSSQGAEANLGVNFAEIYRNSFLYEQNKTLIRGLSVPSPGSQDLHFSTKYSQNFLTQCKASLWKLHWSYWRNPDYNAVRIFFTMVIALMVGTVYWNVGSSIEEDKDVLNVLGAVYAATLFLGITNANTVQPVVDIERTVFYREKAAGMYSAVSYAVSQVLIEIPYTLVQTIIYAMIVYSTMSLTWSATKVFWYLFFMFFTFLNFTLYGMMSVAVSPNATFAAIISASFYAFWNLFSGFMISKNRIPIWWRWYYWGNPVSWALYGIITSQWGDLDNKRISVVGSGKMSIAQYLDENFAYHHSFLGAVAGAHVGILVLFTLVFALCIKFLNFQKR